MIKLLFITYTHSNGGGAENVLTTLVNHLDPEKYRIDIIEVNQFLVKKEPLNRNVHLLNPMIKAKKKYMERVINYILQEKPEIIKSLFRLYGYDVIIAWNNHSPSFCLHSFKKEIKVAWFHEDRLSNAMYANYELLRLNQLQIKAWEISDRIVTISEKLLQGLKDSFPELAYKAEIIHNGFDVSKIQQLSIKNIDINIPSQCKNIIIGMGRLEQNKNYELLIRAVSCVIHSGINCFLVILGQGELLSALKNIAAQENINDAVLFTGYQQNPYPYFKFSRIVCLTSFSEGFPTVIVEGMSLGKPFVTTPVAGASWELADNGRCGLVSDWNIEEYAACIKKLLTEQNLYEEMSKNCIEKAAEFSVENTINKFDAMIEKLYDTSDYQNKTDDLESQSLRKRIWAICYFTLVFAFVDLKKNYINESFMRYKSKSSLINGIKFIYRFMMLIPNIFLFPFRFLAGLILGFFLGICPKN